jgi:hypothetical protein
VEQLVQVLVAVVLVLQDLLGQEQEGKEQQVELVLLHKLTQQKETLQLILLAVVAVQVPQLVQIIEHQVEVVAVVKLEIQVIMEQQE